MYRIFTIGYSGLDQSTFIDFLRDNHVEVVCDVRSIPFSRRRPEFSRAPLKVGLNAGHIKYAFFGGELGARPKDRTCYEGNIAQYARIAASSFFQAGLQRLRMGASKTNLALLCSERDPIECHRAILVCRHLSEMRSNIFHIHTDGKLESQEELDERLVLLHETAPPPLLRSPGDYANGVERAYDLQGEAIAYTEPYPMGVGA